ncbi:MAG TPA: hypothetical protein VEB66_06165 [Opitutaceae bacterium]|nr:hypothetical protein [Opitutaceae bacterium]
MTDQRLIDLPGLRLPHDLARRAKFVAEVERVARRLGLNCDYEPPRFVGYYFLGTQPVVAAGRWTVTVGETELLDQLQVIVQRVTEGRFAIASEGPAEKPEFMLIHDRYDGSCWLWDFTHGHAFLSAEEPAAESDDFAGEPE